MTIIGVQGDPGSFSEEAANQFIKREQVKDHKIQYLVNSENVLSAIENGDIDIGICAIENSQGGIVNETLFALAKHRCNIIDMFHIHVQQNLLTLPGVKANQITSIHSHQQALRQCRTYLSENFNACPLVEEEDTAKSAKSLSEGRLPETAAVIANKACAKLFGLAIFDENINDLKENLTQFLALSRYPGE